MIKSLDRQATILPTPAHGWQINYGTQGTTTLRPRTHEVSTYHLGLTFKSYRLYSAESDNGSLIPCYASTPIDQPPWEYFRVPLGQAH